MIDWHCDNCNCLMNNQDGFNTSTGRWVCSQCGYENDVSEHNIVKHKVHVFKCKKMGYDEEEVGIWFDADVYSERDAKSQFHERYGETKKSNGEYYPFTYFEYEGEKFFDVEYVGLFDEDNLPHGFSGFPWRN